MPSKSKRSTALSPPPPNTNIDWADITGWLMRYAVLPLSPFFIGAIIRYIARLRFSLSIFEPAELAFSLAMFCMLVTISSRQLRDSDYKHTIAGLFTFGAFLFVALFATSVLFSELFVNNMQIFVQSLIMEVSNPSASPNTLIENYMNANSLETNYERQLLILYWVAFLGSLFIGVGIRYRHIYGLGDEE